MAESFKGNLGSAYTSILDKVLAKFDTDSEQSLENAAKEAAQGVAKIGVEADKAKKKVDELSEAIKELNKSKGSRNPFFMPDLSKAEKALESFYTDWTNMGDKSQAEQKKIMNGMFKMIASFKAQFGDGVGVSTIFNDKEMASFSDKTKEILAQVQSFYEAIQSGKSYEFNGLSVNKNSFGIGNSFDEAELRQHFKEISKLTQEELESVQGIADGVGKAISDTLLKAVKEAAAKAREQAESQEPIFKAKSFVDRNLKTDLQRQIEDAITGIENLVNKRKVRIASQEKIHLEDIRNSDVKELAVYKNAIEAGIKEGTLGTDSGIDLVNKQGEVRVASLIELIDRLNARIQVLQNRGKSIQLISKDNIRDITNSSKQVAALLETAQKARAQLEQIDKFDKETKGMASAKGIESLQGLTKKGNEFGAFFDEIRKNIGSNEDAAEQAIERIKEKLRELGVVYNTETGFGKAGEEQAATTTKKKTGRKKEEVSEEDIKDDYIYTYKTYQKTDKYTKQKAEQDAEAYYQAFVKAINEKDVSKIYEFLDSKKLPDTVTDRTTERNARKKLAKQLLGTDVSTKAKLDEAMQAFNPEGFQQYQAQLQEMEQAAQHQAEILEVIKQQQKEFDEQTKAMTKKKAYEGFSENFMIDFKDAIKTAREEIDGSENAVSDAIQKIEDKLKEAELVFKNGKFMPVDNIQAATQALGVEENTLKRIIELLKESQSFKNMKNISLASAAKNEKFDPNKFAGILANDEQGIKDYLANAFAKGSIKDLTDIFSANKLWGGKTDITDAVFGSLSSDELKQKAAIFGKVIGEYISQWEQSSARLKSIKDELAPIFQGIADTMDIKIDSSKLEYDLFSGIRKSATKDAESTADWILKEIKHIKEKVESSTPKPDKTEEKSAATSTDTDSSTGKSGTEKAAKEVKTLAEMYEEAGKQVDAFKEKLRSLNNEALKGILKDDLGVTKGIPRKKEDLVNRISEEYISSLTGGTQSATSAVDELINKALTKYQSVGGTGTVDLSDTKKLLEENVELAQSFSAALDKVETADDFNKLREQLVSVKDGTEEASKAIEYFKQVAEGSAAAGTGGSQSQEEINKRVSKIVQLINGNKDYEQYGEFDWLQEYINRAREETTAIDELYADFERRLKERKESIQREMDREVNQGLNQDKFKSFLSGAIWAAQDTSKFEQVFERYKDLFNSITDDVTTLDAAINKVKEDMAAMGTDTGGTTSQQSEIERRQEEIKRRISENEYFEQYGNPDWLSEYMEKAKEETTAIDDLYADFEKRLKERMDSIKKQKIDEIGVEAENLATRLESLHSTEIKEGQDGTYYQSLSKSITEVDKDISKLKEDLQSINLNDAPAELSEKFNSITASLEAATKKVGEYKDSLQKAQETAIVTEKTESEGSEKVAKRKEKEGSAATKAGKEKKKSSEQSTEGMQQEIQTLDQLKTKEQEVTAEVKKLEAELKQLGGVKSQLEEIIGSTRDRRKAAASLLQQETSSAEERTQNYNLASVLYSRYAINGEKKNRNPLPITDKYGTDISEALRKNGEAVEAQLKSYDDLVSKLNTKKQELEKIQQDIANVSASSGTTEKKTQEETGRVTEDTGEKAKKAGEKKAEASKKGTEGTQQEIQSLEELKKKLVEIQTETDGLREKLKEIKYVKGKYATIEKDNLDPLKEAKQKIEVAANATDDQKARAARFQASVYYSKYMDSVQDGNYERIVDSKGIDVTDDLLTRSRNIKQRLANHQRIVDALNKKLEEATNIMNTLGQELDSQESEVEEYYKRAKKTNQFNLDPLVEAQKKIIESQGKSDIEFSKKREAAAAYYAKYMNQIDDASKRNGTEPVYSGKIVDETGADITEEVRQRAEEIRTAVKAQTELRKAFEDTKKVVLDLQNRIREEEKTIDTNTEKTEKNTRAQRENTKAKKENSEQSPAPEQKPAPETQTTDSGKKPQSKSTIETNIRTNLSRWMYQDSNSKDVDVKAIVNSQEMADEIAKKVQIGILYMKELGGNFERLQNNYKTFVEQISFKPKEVGLEELRKEILESGKTIEQAWADVKNSGAVKGQKNTGDTTQQRTQAPPTTPSPTPQKPAPQTTPGTTTPQTPSDIGGETTKFGELETAVTNVNKAILYKNSLLNAEKEIVDQNIGVEATKFGELGQAITDVNKAVLYKNSLFNEEKGIVEEAIGAEIDKVGQLKNALNTGISEVISEQMTKIAEMKAELESLSQGNGTGQASGEMTEAQKAIQKEIDATKEKLKGLEEEYHNVSRFMGESWTQMYGTIPQNAEEAISNVERTLKAARLNPDDIKALADYNYALEQALNLGQFDDELKARLEDESLSDKFTDYINTLSDKQKELQQEITNTTSRIAELQQQMAEASTTASTQDNMQQEFTETGETAEKAGEKIEQSQTDTQEKVAKTKRTIEELKQAYEELLAVYNQTGDKDSFITALNKEFTGKNEIRTLARRGLDLHGEYNKGQWVSQIADQAEQNRLAAQGTIAQPEIPAEQANKEYEELREKIAQVTKEIENVKTALSSLDEKFMLDSEAQIFTELINTLEKLIPEAIETKNQAFKSEENVVRQVVDNEKKILGELETAIRHVVEAINFKNVGLQDLSEIIKVFEQLKGSLDTQAMTNFYNELDRVLQKLKEFSGVNVGEDSIFGTLKDILGHTDQLRNFADILKESEEKIKDAAEAADAMSDKDPLKAIGKELEIFDIHSEEWAKFIELAQKAQIELGNVKSVFRSLRKDTDGNIFESFRVVDFQGNSNTIGADTEGIIARKDKSSLNIDTLVNNYQNALERLSKASKTDDIINFRNQILELDRSLSELVETSGLAGDKLDELRKTRDIEFTKASETITSNEQKEKEKKDLKDGNELIKEQIKLISQLITARTENNSLRNKELKNGGDENNPSEILAISNQKVAETAAQARQGMIALMDIFRSGRISWEDFSPVLNLYRSDEAKKGSLSSLMTLQQTRADIEAEATKKAEQNEKDQQKAADRTAKDMEAKWEKARKAAIAYFDAAKKVKDIMDAIDAGAKDPNKFTVKQSLENAKSRMERMKTVAEQAMDNITGYSPIDVGQNMVAANKIYNTYADTNGNIINPEFMRLDNAANIYTRLTKEAEKYYRLLYKQKSEKSLTYNEKQYLEQMIPLYEKLNSSASDYIANLTEAQKESLPQDYQTAVSTAKQKPVVDQYDALKGKVESFKDWATTPALIEWINKAETKLSSLQSEIANTNWVGDTEDDARKIDIVTQHVRDFEQEVNKASQRQDFIQVSEADTAKLKRRMSEWIQNNSAAKEAIEQIKAYQRELQNVTDKGALTDIETKFEKIKAEANEAGNVGKSFGEKLKGSLGNLARYLMSFASFYRIIGTLKQAVNIVKELDDAMVEIRKVTTATANELERFSLDSFNMADKFGTTAKQIQESTAAWLRLGEDFKSATESAQMSAFLLNTTEITSIDEATSDLVSISQAYKEISKSDIIDKLNNIGDHFSSSSSDLASGMKNAAAVLKTQGNDIDKTLALLTAGCKMPERQRNLLLSTHLIALIA